MANGTTDGIPARDAGEPFEHGGDAGDRGRAVGLVLESVHIHSEADAHSGKYVHGGGEALAKGGVKIGGRVVRFGTRAFVHGAEPIATPGLRVATIAAAAAGVDHGVIMAAVVAETEATVADDTGGVALAGAAFVRDFILLPQDAAHT